MRDWRRAHLVIRPGVQTHEHAASRESGCIHVKVPRPPPPSSPAATSVMKANRPFGTRPEIVLRTKLVELGVRGYRMHSANLPGRPDVAFGSSRLAVFVHGCFWHRHGCRAASRRLPHSNRAYWKVKFRLNRERDSRKIAALRASGWKVLVVWECELKEDPDLCASRVRRALTGRQRQKVRSKDVSSRTGNPQR